MGGIYFNPYGQIFAFGAGDSAQDGNEDRRVKKIAGDIAKNSAIREALVSAIHQEKEKRKRKHWFRLLGKKRQAEVIRSALRGLELDFSFLKEISDIYQKEGEKKRKSCSHRVKHKAAEKKKVRTPVQISKQAEKAISAAAESWLVARNKGLLELARTLFLSEDGKES